MAPHQWFVQPKLGLYISFGVGYCFIWYKAMREASSKDKAISSHTFFFTRLYLGIVKAEQNQFNTNENIKNVKNGRDSYPYECRLCILQ